MAATGSLEHQLLTTLHRWRELVADDLDPDPASLQEKERLLAKVRQLLVLGVKVNVASDFDTPIQMAVKMGEPVLVGALLQHGADGVRGQGRSALSEALRQTSHAPSPHHRDLYEVILHSLLVSPAASQCPPAQLWSILHHCVTSHCVRLTHALPLVVRCGYKFMRRPQELGGDEWQVLHHSVHLGFFDVACVMLQLWKLPRHRVEAAQQAARDAHTACQHCFPPPAHAPHLDPLPPASGCSDACSDPDFLRLQRVLVTRASQPWSLKTLCRAAIVHDINDRLVAAVPRLSGLARHLQNYLLYPDVFS